mgnify:CR=1 FL=1
MLCEKCKIREANVFYTEIIDGDQKNEHHLCTVCAREFDQYSSIFDKDFSFSKLLSGILGDVFEKEDNDNGEINMWMDTVKSKGILSKNINAMNDYLTRLMEQGIIGSIIFIMPFIIALYRLFCNRRNLNEGDQIKLSVTLLTLLGCLISNINGSSTVVYCTWVSLAIAYAFTYKFSKLNM